MNPIIYPNCNDILYLEANINYTIFHLIDGRTFLSSTTLKRHEAKEALASFLRINKSYLLNPDFIENIEQDGEKVFVKMTNEKQMMVSRRKVKILESRIKV
jgi:DNA-binding LytR/AlgR family response regulator